MQFAEFTAISGQEPFDCKIKFEVGEDGPLHVVIDCFNTTAQFRPFGEWYTKWLRANGYDELCAEGTKDPRRWKTHWEVPAGSPTAEQVAQLKEKLRAFLIEKGFTQES